jgi:hypothetical protein
VKVTAFSAGVEAITGIVLIIAPSLVAQFLLGTELSAGGQAVGRVAGFALVSLGLACWPQREPGNHASAALRGLLTYNVLAAIFFVYVGVSHEFAGLLLWPAAVLHAALAILLGRIFVIDNRN